MSGISIGSVYYYSFTSVKTFLFGFFYDYIKLWDLLLKLLSFYFDSLGGVRGLGITAGP